MLLEDPASLAQRAVQDVLAKVVNGLADVKRAFGTVLESEEGPPRAGPQEARVLARGATRGDHAVRTAKHVLHALRLAFPVTILPLYDADGIDPEIPNAESARGVYGVPKSCREFPIWDGLSEFVELVAIAASVYS